MIWLDDLPPAQYQAWEVLLRLPQRRLSWVLIGGQMMALLGTEHGGRLPRTTLDADVLVDVRATPGALETLAAWLRDDQGFQLQISSANVGHRFTRPAAPGPGTVMFDLLAPEGLGPRTRLYTVRPARTFAVPGSASLLRSAELVDVRVRDVHGNECSGAVRRPSVLSALIGKAEATTIAVRANRSRDTEDAALLLSILSSPRMNPAELTRSERAHLRRLQPLAESGHPAWRLLPPDHARLGQAALHLILRDLAQPG